MSEQPDNILSSLVYLFTITVNCPSTCSYEYTSQTVLDEFFIFVVSGVLSSLAFYNCSLKLSECLYCSYIKVTIFYSSSHDISNKQPKIWVWVSVNESITKQMDVKV